jgi:glycosyltransferase involved in cell wall biosynthesis
LGELLRGFARLPRGEFLLDIVGTGPDARRLRQLASSLGLSQEVTFLGSLERSAVAQRYRDADLFTLPSSAEAFGNVFAEALASGLPIVGSNIGGIPELVEHGKNGLLVDPGSPDALAQAILYLADDAELRESMGRRNRLKAERQLEWIQVTRQYLSLYDSLVRRRPVPELVPPSPVSAL